MPMIRRYVEKILIAVVLDYPIVCVTERRLLAMAYKRTHVCVCVCMCVCDAVTIERDTERIQRTYE